MNFMHQTLVSVVNQLEEIIDCSSYALLLCLWSQPQQMAESEEGLMPMDNIWIPQSPFPLVIDEQIPCLARRQKGITCLFHIPWEAAPCTAELLFLTGSMYLIFCCFLAAMSRPDFSDSCHRSAVMRSICGLNPSLATSTNSPIKLSSSSQQLRNLKFAAPESIREHDVSLGPKFSWQAWGSSFFFNPSFAKENGYRRIDSPAHGTS